MGYNSGYMDLTSLPSPIFIARPQSLNRLAKELLRESRVAVDTESNSLYAYQEQVCLIQFSTRRADYLLDPLALEDLSPLAPLFNSPDIEKVFHAAEYDLICLKRDFGFEFNNLFDTMVAARVLGWEEIGLGSILRAEFNVRMDKRHQRANWGQRPLPQQMLTYAQLDTHYLIALRERQYAELVKNNMLPLATEDFERLRQSNGSTNGHKPDDCWRVNGAHDLRPQNAAVLMELCHYRDQVAKSINRPLFKVIGDKTLVEIAAICPMTQEELRYIQGMTERQMKRHAKGLLAAVQRGLNERPIYPPRHPRPDDDYLARLEALRQWRKATAQMMGVSSDVVLPRDLMYALANQNPSQPGELGDVLQDVPWRREHFGEQILRVLADY